MINGDNIFDSALVSFVKELTIKYVKELDTGSFKYIIQQYYQPSGGFENQSVNELINYIRNSQEPNELVIRMIAGAMDCTIEIQNLEINGNMIQKRHKLQSGVNANY